jgi:hypothetical protein
MQMYQSSGLNAVFIVGRGARGGEMAVNWYEVIQEGLMKEGTFDIQSYLLSTFYMVSTGEKGLGMNKKQGQKR